MTLELDREEFAAGYVIEADEHVRSSIANLLAIDEALRSGGPQHRQLRELFRSLHTLKGVSAMVGIDPIVDLAHEMESILRDADRGTTKLGAQGVELLLQGVRAIEVRIGAFAKKQAVLPAPSQLLTALAELQMRPRTAPARSGGTLILEPDLAAKLSPPEYEHLAQQLAAGRRAVRIDFFPSPERSAAGFSISTVREKLAELGEIVKVVPRAVPKDAQAPGGLSFALLVLSDADIHELARAASTELDSVHEIQLEPTPGSEFSADEYEDDPADLVQLNRGFIRVEVERLDDALEKLSALVVTRFKLTNAVTSLRERGVDVRELSGILNENQRQLRDLRRAITRARMVSVGELLERVPLIVRGMNRTTGKQVNLQLNAGKAELDKSVAERVFPALVHLIRNAVDHAIESPEERTRLGKPPEGTIIVACHEHSDTQLEIRVSDDGRGIDVAALSRRLGRGTPNDDRGILDLITQPGVSTRVAATSSSGRGMGMDIVRRIAVDMLGGDLTLQTQAGRGTTFTMRLPLSISILDSFSFVCGAQAFAVPVSIVDEIVDLSTERIVQPPAPRETGRKRNGGTKSGRARESMVQLIERRGEAIPLFRLARLLKLAATPDGHGKAFIVRPQGQPFAFAIDRVLGQQEIVVRPLEDRLVKVPGVAGTTDLGDGKPTLVLDLAGLSNMAAARSGSAA